MIWANSLIKAWRLGLGNRSSTRSFTLSTLPSRVRHPLGV